MAKIKKIKLGNTTYDICDADAVHTVKQDGITGATVNRFGTCSTGGSTAAKTVSITTGTFTLETGVRVTVKFTNKNTAKNPTLNVNSTGAKNIFHDGVQVKEGVNIDMLCGTVDFVYDGTQWQLVGNYVDTHNSHTVISGNKKDGSTPIQGAASATDITLGDSGVAKGSYGPSADETPSHTGTFSVPEISVNEKGIVTGAATRKVKIPAETAVTITNKSNTDTTDLVYAVSNLVEGGTNGHAITPTYTGLPTKAYVDKVATGHVKYLGTVNALSKLSTTAGLGDFYRVSTAFTFGSETAHVGDIILATKDNPAQNTTDWDLIHTEVNTDTWKVNTKDVSGYVSAPGEQAYKAWQTDSAGNPGWRALKEANLEWGGRFLSSAISPVSAALSAEHSANRLAFLNPKALLFEVSDDAGASWEDLEWSDEKKILHVTKSEVLSIGGSSTVTTDQRARMTISAQGYVYTRPRKLLVNMSTQGHAVQMTIEYKSGASGAAWNTLGTYNISGWSGWNDIDVSTLYTLGGGSTQTSNYWYWRFTYTTTTVSSSYATSRPQILGIRLFGETAWTTTSNMGSTGHLYDYDYAQNAIFPAKVKASKLYEDGTAINEKYQAISTVHSTDTSSKIFLVGTTEQGSSKKAYSHDTAYVGTDGCLYSNKTKVSVVGHGHGVSTANAAPNAHTHTVTVNGTTGKNSGSAIKAATAIGVSSSSSAAPGGHTHSYDKTTGVALTANTTTTTGDGRITYVQSISSTKASASGTAKVGSETHTHNYSKTTGVTLTANTETDTGRVTYVESISGSKPTLGGTKTFVTGVTAGSGSLTSNTTSTDGIAYIASASHTAASLGTPSTSSAAPGGHTHVYSKATGVSLTANTASATGRITYVQSISGSAPTLGGTTTFVTSIAGGSGSLEAYDAATNGTKKVSNGTRVPVITSLSKSGYTPAGSVTLTAGTAPSMGAATTKYLSAAPSSTSTNTNSATVASYSAGVLTISSSHTHTYDKATGVTLTANTSSATGRIQYVHSQGTFSAGTTPKASASFTGTESTAVVTGGTTYYLAHAHTAASASGTGTVTISGGSYTPTTRYLSAAPTNTDTNSGANSGTNFDAITGYPSFSGGSGSHTTKYLHHTHTSASSAGTGTVSISGGEYTSTTKYLSAAPSNTTTASAAPSATTSVVTGVQGGTTSATTRYLSAAPTNTATTSAANSGTNFNAATAVSITSTGNAAPNEHTHSYGSTTALTTTANSGSAVAAVTEVKDSTT